MLTQGENSYYNENPSNLNDDIVKVEQDIDELKDE